MYNSSPYNSVQYNGGSSVTFIPTTNPQKELTGWTPNALPNDTSWTPNALPNDTAWTPIP